MKSLLENAEMRPSPGVWERIERELPDRPAAGKWQGYVPFAFFVVVSSISAMLLREVNLPGRDTDPVAVQTTASTSTTNELNAPAETANAVNASPGSENQVFAQPVTGSITSGQAGTGLQTKTPGKTATSTLNNSGKHSASANIKNNVKAGSSVSNQPNSKYASSPGYTSSYYAKQNNIGAAAAMLEELMTSQNASTNKSVTASLNRQELDRILETEAMLASVSPVHASALPRTGREVLSYMSPVEVKNEQVEKANELAKANAEKLLKKQNRLDQFKTYDVVRGFHAGLFFSISANRLTRKFDHLENESNTISSRALIGKSYGINIGYDFTKRWGLQLEWAISDQGQKYIEKSSEEETKKQLKLTYMKIPLLAKYKIKQISEPGKRPIVFSVLAGPQINFLLKKQVFVEGVSRPVNTGVINKTEIGLMSGLDMDFYLHKNFFMTLGARAGLCSPVQKNKPMSFQFGLTTQFHFRKPPKE